MRAVLDCMARGVPVILNRYAEFCDYPADTVVFTPETVHEESIAEAITSLAASSVECARIGRAAHEHVALHHQPRRIASDYSIALQRFVAEGWGRDPRKLIAAAQKSGTTAASLMAWLKTLAESDATARPLRTYLDITEDSPACLQQTLETYGRLREAGQDVWPVHYMEGGTVLLAGHPLSTPNPRFLKTTMPIHVQYGDIALLRRRRADLDSPLAARLREAGVSIRWLNAPAGHPCLENSC